MKIFHITILLLISVSVFSQSEKKRKKEKYRPSISVNYAYGNIMSTNPFIKGINMHAKPMKHYQAYSLKAVWQNPGYTNWQKIYKCPYYGIGITVSDFYNPDEVGYPISYYGILGIPIKRWKKLELYKEIQLGITNNWRKYDSINNPYNIAVGSSHTVHLNIGVNAYYPINKHLDLGAGMSFIHFSNGGIKRPNIGLNIYLPSVELKYHLSDRPNTKNIKSPGKLKRSNDLFFMMGYGIYQLLEYRSDNKYFTFVGLTSIYFNQISNAFRLGAGIDFNYFWETNNDNESSIFAKKNENFTIGFILQPEIIIDKLTIIGGVGIYAKNIDYGNFKQTYQRLGIRYEIYNNFSIGINVRSMNFKLAKFLEFNLGYRIRWMK